MARIAVAVALAVLSIPAAAVAQQPQAPMPLYPGAPPPPSYEAQPLPPPKVPPSPTQDAPSLPSAAAPPAPAAALPAQAPGLSDQRERVFCDQPVSVQVADPDAVAERHRAFIGIWSDASWTPSLCAALIVENVTPDGTATILYVYGPMGTNLRAPAGVLRGTGIIRDGELRFQNSDGSQFAFRPVYADLNGRLTTPRGEKLEAFFKKTP